ncbi:MAG TPA: hypothetical protein PKH26_05650 [Phycisphaerae bacterium]|nr:hypothetical protein [Phycisphaerae bacterium]
MPGVPGANDAAHVSDGVASITEDASVLIALVGTGGGIVQTGGLSVAEQMELSHGGFCQQTDGTTVARWEFVGYLGDGTFLQTGGLNYVWEGLALGHEPGSEGSYHLSGSAELQVLYEDVAWAGIGRFFQTGGAHSTDGRLAMGGLPDAVGTFELSGGTLDIAEGLVIGGQGTATFTQIGGALSIAGWMDLANDPGGNGTFTLSGGTLELSEPVYVGIEGTGRFIHETGAYSTSALVVGDHASGNGTYELHSSGHLSASDEEIGAFGEGTFDQSGGSNTVADSIGLGVHAGSDGTYDLTDDGTLSARWLGVGIQGSGTFAHGGGSVSLFGGLGIACQAGSDGRYELGMPALLDTPFTNVGESGQGIFVQTGGNHVVREFLHLGLWLDSDGEYELDDGVLSLSDASSDLVVGAWGHGNFTQSGGTATCAGGVVIGQMDTGNGSYELRTGGLTAHHEAIGYYGSGTFAQRGGTNTVTSDWGVVLGHRAGSSGTYDLRGGTLLTSGTVTIGWEGTGVFTQDNGSLTVDGIGSGIGIGGQFGAEGLLELNGGSITVSSWMDVGQGGTGTLKVTGPSASLSTPYLEVGHQSGTGTFNIQTTGADIMTRTLVLGGQCTFSALPGAAIEITSQGGSLQNYATDEVALGGLANLNLICNGDPTYLEVGGYDDGVPSAYCWFGENPNFQIDLLTINGVLHLVDDADNGNRGGTCGWGEALYVNAPVDEWGWGPSGKLYTHGLHVYANCELLTEDHGGHVCYGSGCGDFDHDCDADLTDFLDFVACLSGPEASVGAECNPGDCDADGDMDLADFALFQAEFTGPGD